MPAEAFPPLSVRRRRWTPARLIVLGAVLGFGPVALDAAVSLSSNLAFLGGVIGAVPYGLLLLDAALMGLMVPVGLFLVLGGILLHLRSLRPPGHSRSFRAGLGGAEVNLAAGLLLGVVNFSLYVLPPELLTADFARNVVMVLFLGTVAAAAGLLIAFCGMAALVREEPLPRTIPVVVRVRAPREKDIYRDAPSAR